MEPKAVRQEDYALGTTKLDDDKTLRMAKPTHTRLRVEAARRGVSSKALADKIINWWLDKFEGL